MSRGVSRRRRSILADPHSAATAGPAAAYHQRVTTLDDRRRPTPDSPRRHPGDVAAVLVATADGLHALAADGAPRRVLDGDIAALAVRGDTVWAVVGDTALARGRLDGGWRTMAVSDRPLRCVLPRDGDVLAGTAGAGLVRLDDAGLRRVAGFDDVAGRGSWFTPWGGPPDTRSLAAGADGAVYANVHVGGIPASVDGGVTWRPTIAVEADVHQVAVAGGLVLAAAAGGLAVSADGAATWRWRTEGLHARYARAVAATDETVLVSVSQGPGGARSALYRGALATDGPLTRCREGLPEWFGGNIDTAALAAHGPVVVAADGGTVHRSADGGITWGVLARGLAEVRGVAMMAG